MLIEIEVQAGLEIKAQRQFSLDAVASRGDAAAPPLRPWSTRQPVQPWQHAIQHDHIRQMRADKIECRVSIVGRQYAAPPALQVHAYQIAQALLVINDQHGCC